MTATTATPAAAVAYAAAPTPSRNMYQHHLKMIAYSLAECARLNPCEGHRLTTILAEIQAIQDGR